MKHLLRDAETVRKIFILDGSTLRWRVRTGPRSVPGNVAGWTTFGGYMRVQHGTSKEYVHKIIWLMNRGVWPKDEIDHINGDPSDNRIENSREATRAQNTQNRRRCGDGVSWSAKEKRWRVEVQSNGVRHFFGGFTDKGEATRVAHAAINKLHGEFSRLIGRNA